MSRYDLFRRRIAPIAFGLAIVLMARQACHDDERHHATFVLDLGDRTRDVRVVDAELWMGGEPIAQFHRAALDGSTIGTPRFDAVVPGTDGELRIDVEVAGAHRHTVRSIHVDEGATVTVPLARDLRP